MIIKNTIKQKPFKHGGEPHLNGLGIPYNLHNTCYTKGLTDYQPNHVGKIKLL